MFARRAAGLRRRAKQEEGFMAESIFTRIQRRLSGRLEDLVDRREKADSAAVMREAIREAVAYRAEPPPISRRTRRPTARLAPRLARATAGGSTQRRVRARSAK